jgi:hypothetical protein
VSNAASASTIGLIIYRRERNLSGFAVLGTAVAGTLLTVQRSWSVPPLPNINAHFAVALFCSVLFCSVVFLLRAHSGWTLCISLVLYIFTGCSVEPLFDSIDESPAVGWAYVWLGTGTGTAAANFFGSATKLGAGALAVSGGPCTSFIVAVVARIHRCPLLYRGAARAAAHAGLDRFEQSGRDSEKQRRCTKTQADTNRGTADAADAITRTRTAAIITCITCISSKRRLGAAAAAAAAKRRKERSWTVVKQEILESFFSSNTKSKSILLLLKLICLLDSGSQIVNMSLPSKRPPSDTSDAQQ